MRPKFLEKLFFPFFDFFFFYFGKLDPERAFQRVVTSNITSIIPVIGYGIFFASLADFLHVLFPLQLFNPAWELQTIGSLIDQSWALLIGMGFIGSRYFTENHKDTRLIEFLFLKFIRWFFLILAILYLFLTPLVILNSFRMTTQIRQQVAQEQNAKTNQIDQIQIQSSRITNPDQLRALAQSININKDDIERLSNDKLPASIKQKLFSVKTKIEEEAAIALRNQLQKLWQNSIRMIFSQILLAFTFIFIWSKFGRLGKLDMIKYDIEK
jgi:hypothetical protein